MGSRRIASVASAALALMLGAVTASAPAGQSSPGPGELIAFQRDSGVWVVGAYGGETRLLARGAHGPVWSPDGRRIAFVRWGRTTSGIYVMDLYGGQERRLTREPVGATPVTMSWSPNGRVIAFYRQYDRPGTCGPLRQAGDIFVMGVDGTGARRLTKHGQAHYSAAVWSPDSRQIAITSCHGPPRGDPDIYLLHVDGSGEKRLTRRPGWDGPEGWSRDGRTLLVNGQVDSTGPSDLYLISADGSRRRNLTRGDEHEFGGAAWSPDQRRIAFVRVAGGGRLHIMNADGSGLRSLNALTVPDNAPSWSPDGKRLAFTSWNDGRFRWDVHVMNADGTNRRNVTPGGGAGPVWMPASR